MLAATQDTLYPENAAIYDHLGTSDKAFISFVGPDHMMIYDQRMVERMAHFATAFFGYHLAGREELARTSRRPSWRDTMTSHGAPSRPDDGLPLGRLRAVRVEHPPGALLDVLA